MHKIQPIILGHGTSGQAINKSLAIITLNSEDKLQIKLLPPIFVNRDQPLKNYLSVDAKNVLFVANLSGLHATAILEAAASNYDMVVCDKPCGVTLEEIAQLKNVAIPVTVLHGYRVMWGPRTIHQMINGGQLGEIFAIEHRYWQSSVARSAVSELPPKKTWKDDLKLNGPYDAFVDLGTHSIDMILYLMKAQPEKSYVTLSYANSLSEHRDTHLHLNLRFPNKCLAQASISKTMHGATNNFEITVLGTKASATWVFQNPDEIAIGCGSKITTLRREVPNIATGSNPFHAMGWLEGYVEIILQSLKSLVGLESQPVPILQEEFAVMSCILQSKS